MSSINKLLRSIVIFKNKFNNYKDVTFELIVDFAFKLLFEEELIDINNIILDILINELLNKNEDKRDFEEEYYFDKSNTLKIFMAQIYAYSLINQYLCVAGPLGIGNQ